MEVNYDGASKEAEFSKVKCDDEISRTPFMNGTVGKSKE